MENTFDQKKLMKMDRIKLMELLQEVLHDNDTLTQRASQLEAANARLILSTREAGIAKDEAVREAEDLRAAQADLSKLPTGSFAEAMVQSLGIVEKTQAAADAYLAHARAVVDAAKQEANTLLADAHTRADAVHAEAKADREQAQAELEAARAEAEALLGAAKTEAETIANEASANKARVDNELQGMTARLQAEMQHFASLMQGMSAPEAAE